ncbi:flagellar basal body rod protein FlgC [Erythrobacter sp. SCSIO 43205]|uniref:flagellar basal body rod protein FlgC n=1 Tax=Erythrobacter sp. SCSIO 43205 TaxID=2779361 RepID=UPI001CA9D88D|nr:flagellar basal body protein [Erythrobacter sp. SCSIO 43205]UAB78722.1 flagellar basal body rod protein FlgC [Erythrobacter sp. SCSIO 43205]
MSDGRPNTLFSLAEGAMSAQLVRMNAATSNLANAGSVSGTVEGAYRPIRAVFQTALDEASGIASVSSTQLVRSNANPIERYDPANRLANEEGNVFEAPIDESAEMLEIMESARQYQNMVQALQTARQLMLDTLRSNS